MQRVRQEMANNKRENIFKVKERRQFYCLAKLNYIEFLKERFKSLSCQGYSCFIIVMIIIEGYKDRHNPSGHRRIRTVIK